MDETEQHTELLLRIQHLERRLEKLEQPDSGLFPPKETFRSNSATQLNEIPFPNLDQWQGKTDSLLEKIKSWARYHPQKLPLPPQIPLKEMAAIKLVNQPRKILREHLNSPLATKKINLQQLIQTQEVLLHKILREQQKYIEEHVEAVTDDQVQKSRQVLERRLATIRAESKMKKEERKRKRRAWRKKIFRF